MHYRVSKDNDKELVVRKNLFVITLYYILLILGLLFFIPGILLFFIPETTLFTNYILGFGFILLSAAALLKITEKKFPLEFQFDYQQETLFIRSSSKKELAIGFGEIAGVHLYSKKEEGFVVYTELKNGAVWDLLILSKKEKAKEIAERLNKKIKGSDVIAEVKSELPVWIKSKISKDRITYYWKDNDLFVQLGLVFLLIWGMSLAITFSYINSPYQNIYLMVVNTLLLLIAVYLGLRIYKSQKTYKVLRIAKNNIVFGISKPEDSDQPAELIKSYDRNEVGGCRYNLDKVNNLQFSILFPDKNDCELLTQLRKGNPAEFFSTYKTLKDYRKLFRVDITGRDIIDIARFERIIRKDLEKTNHQ